MTPHTDARQWLENQPDIIDCPLACGCRMTLRACQLRQKAYVHNTKIRDGDGTTTNEMFLGCRSCERFHYRGQQGDDLPQRTKITTKEYRTERAYRHKRRNCNERQFASVTNPRTGDITSR